MWALSVGLVIAVIMLIAWLMTVEPAPAIAYDEPMVSTAVPGTYSDLLSLTKIRARSFMGGEGMCGYAYARQLHPYERAGPYSVALPGTLVRPFDGAKPCIEASWGMYSPNGKKFNAY